MKKNWIKKVPAVILIATLGVAALSGVVMLLWNNILPAVLHVGTITLWQAMGILVLSRLLFGGFKGKRPMAGRQWKKYTFGKWQDMSPEEKELFAGRHNCRHKFAVNQ